MPGRVIAFVNFKGGVGKTANVVNIGANLAKYHGRRVLIVDLDAQSNSSLWLMRPEDWRRHTGNRARSVFQIFHDKIKGTRLFDFDKAIVRAVPRREFPLIANLDLLPAVIDLLKIEQEIQPIRSISSYHILYHALKPQVEAYDYLFLDCPPNLYTITKNALFAADFVVVPYIPDFLSLSGFEILVDLIHDFYHRMGGFLTARKKPQVAAFIINHFAIHANVFEAGVNEFEIAVNQIQKSGKVHPKAICLKPFIRFNVHVAESTNEHLPIFLHKPNSIGAQDYADLSINFMNHFEVVL